MTCIIGGICSDGIALIADKKVVDRDTEMVEFKEKLFIFQQESFYYPIVVGSSGTIALYEKFKRAAIEEIKKINPVQPPFDYRNFDSGNFDVSGRLYFYNENSEDKRVVLYPYLKKLEDLIRGFKKDYANLGFDVLFAAQVQNRAILFYIHRDGLSEDVHDFKVIGSGESFANVFLKSLYQKNKNIVMRQLAQAGFFIIKYIEESGLNDGVGVGKDRPQIYFVPNEGPLSQADNDFLEECERRSITAKENFENIFQ
ncbi:MAG: hypothetical protein WBL44_11190 [Nitrososphaeraceae archaeon]|jgi:20S proteasome alpha/beta subunit